MSNAGSVILHRLVGFGLPCTRWHASLRTPIAISLVSYNQRMNVKSIISSPFTTRTGQLSSVSSRSQPFSSSSKSALHTAFVYQARDSTERLHEEKGLAFQDRDLTDEQLRHIFGSSAPPPRVANRFLRVLHARRHDGTLDIPLAPSLEQLKRRYPHALDDGLQWLRVNHPFDEDAAILARIEREEAEQEYSPSELQQRAQDIGLYERQEYTGPQSGHYQAPASEKEGDVFGQSIVDEMRAKNLADAEAAEVELQRQIDEKMAKAQLLRDEKEKALTERPEQGIETSDGTVRPPNVYERWLLQKQNEAQSKIAEEQAEQMSLPRRLFPSTVFVALVCAGCYIYAQYWTAPRRADRMFPDISLSFATVGAIVAANVTILAAWRLPMLWRVLNKYFVATPGYPRPVSMLLNTFSHQSKKHILSNMVGILLFGLSLHEEVGRGWFLAIYLASGAFGSWASLTSFTLKKIYTSSSVGASGSLWGVMSAYCWLHANDKFSLVFLPAQIQDQVQFTGRFFLGCMGVYEVIQFVRPIKTVDHAAHLGGLVVGLVLAQLYYEQQKQSGTKRDRKHLRWYEIILGKQDRVDK